MVTRLPRLVIAAPSTGQGKTTIATGLLAALHGIGLEASGHKVGPDYIDPGYHALATGRPGRNLDPHLVGEENIVPLLLHGARSGPRSAEIAVIEGVMGLHDGRIGTDGFASTAHVAALTKSPVVLVVDVSRMSRSVGALVAGMADYDPGVDVVGVILNRAGSARNVAEIERSLRLPVLGVVPGSERVTAPSRHLGLIPAAEGGAAPGVVAALAELVSTHVDLSAVVEVAATAPALDATPWDPTAWMTPVSGEPVVAVAGGRAFSFRYPETDELLRAAGCRVIEFDPLRDHRLPEGTRALYLGGGFPEVYVGQLAANRALLSQIRGAIAAGMPTVGECAGLLYLVEELDGRRMVGAVPGLARMSSRLTLRYPVATAVGDSLLSRTGETVTGHEFHRTQVADLPASPAWQVEEESIGIATDTLHASYLHVHWAGHPHLAQRFAEAAANASVSIGSPRSEEMPGIVAEPGLVDPLLHHGDVEAGPGLVDFAVNVHPEPRPEWLERALAEGLRDSGGYPDIGPARDALASLHRRRPEEVLPTAGAAEAFELIARMKTWQHPVVVHPQFTEPHAALLRAGYQVQVVQCRPEDGWALDPAAVPEEADLVILGNPTNPTGVLHPSETIARLRRPKRVVVVDEAFMDAVPGESESLAGDRRRGLLVVRSLTKHWSMPGIRAGYLLGNSRTIAALAAVQVPWSVSTPALRAAAACVTPSAQRESLARAHRIGTWREHLLAGLSTRGIQVLPSRAPFVLAEIGVETRQELRRHGIALRRADTFPGLGPGWSRIAVRPPETSELLLATLDALAANGA